MSKFYFTYFIAVAYFVNAIWVLWHGDWKFAGYWLSALAITVFSYLLASR